MPRISKYLIECKKDRIKKILIGILKTEHSRNFNIQTSVKKHLYNFV